ncbi:UNVERIFIED_CONTAM: hypothetical protein PYX00_002291 [Menopon gallinae]|uniref:Uncharacterized protein n=1 Tax=Menopon gallinae TaxID=328185 RepID=A0AAW2IHG2_9NEOP
MSPAAGLLQSRVIRWRRLGLSAKPQKGRGAFCVRRSRTGPPARQTEPVRSGSDVSTRPVHLGWEDESDYVEVQGEAVQPRYTRRQRLFTVSSQHQVCLLSVLMKPGHFLRCTRNLLPDFSQTKSRILEGLPGSDVAVIPRKFPGQIKSSFLLPGNYFLLDQRYPDALFCVRHGDKNPELEICFDRKISSYIRPDRVSVLPETHPSRLSASLRATKWPYPVSHRMCQAPVI